MTVINDRATQDHGVHERLLPIDEFDIDLVRRSEVGSLFDIASETVVAGRKLSSPFSHFPHVLERNVTEKTLHGHDMTKIPMQSKFPCEANSPMHLNRLLRH